jgi:HAD superfamily hydrolase (TIGR01450 family)
VLAHTARPLCREYDGALLDLDGVLYLGPEPVPFAAHAVGRARAEGMRCVFVTNNSSRRADVVAGHLSSLGIGAETEDVVTSAHAAVAWLIAQLPLGSEVLVVGTDALAQDVRDAGLRPVRSADRAQAVIQGLGPETSWKDLAEAAVALHRGVPWVAGNADSTYPSARGLLPGNGAFVKVLRDVTGREPVVVGKPEPELHRIAVERAEAERPLVVGDRLDTDILGAVRAGSDSLLVLTGVTDRQQLLAAPPQMRPSYVASDLRGLLEPHPAVVVEGDAATCRESRAWWSDGRVQTSGDDDDALRAACALSWAARD